jgi:hypothetical protein
MNSSNDEHTKWNKQQKSNEKLLSCSVELPSIDKTLKAGRRTITRHMLCAKITNTQTTCRWSLRHTKTNKPFHINYYCVSCAFATCKVICVITDNTDSVENERLHQEVIVLK